MVKQKVDGKKGYVLEILKTLIVSLILTLGLVLLAAGLIKVCNIPTRFIDLIIQLIRIISVLVAVLICFRLPHSFWLRGFIVGVLYIFLAKIIFSLLGGSFSFDFSLFNDATLGGAVGLVCGIISAIFRK